MSESVSQEMIEAKQTIVSAVANTAAKKTGELIEKCGVSGVLLAIALYFGKPYADRAADKGIEVADAHVVFLHEVENSVREATSAIKQVADRQDKIDERHADMASKFDRLLERIGSASSRK